MAIPAFMADYDPGDLVATGGQSATTSLEVMMTLPERDLMSGAPPFTGDAAVTLDNWQDGPANRWSFQHVRELIPTARISRSTGLIRRLPKEEKDLSSLNFRIDNKEIALGELVESTWTDAFLVLFRGRLVTERYFNGMTAVTPHLLMSVSKSVVAAVAGILAGRGLLDADAELSQIVPELAGTSFAGATVRQLLDMRTGTRFSEDYADIKSDVRAYERVYLWRPPHGDGPVAADALEYFTTLENDGPHGGPFRYRSILTDVLGWVLERVAGERLHKLIERELWQPMGAEFDAEITLDSRGNAMADGGICATLRDVGRFGQLYLDRGISGPKAVIPHQWIDDTVAGAPDGAEAFTAGDNPPGFGAGSHYRNCWWVRDPAVPFFSAAGIYGQHIFVHVPTRTVVVILSSWPEPVSAAMTAQLAAATVAIGEALSSDQA